MNANLPVSVSIAASPSGAVCSGTSVTFTATPANGGASPSYQWKKGGSAISGATSSTYSYVPANTDAITCVLTSNATCPTGNPATSNTITETVNANNAVSVSIVASPSGVICSGTSVTFTATPANGGASPSYQWKKGGSAISGATTSTYSYVPANTDAITCVLTSNATCPTGNPATSNTITETVNTLPAASISPIGPIGICSGTTTILTGNTDIGTSYQWKLNGSNITSATQSTYTVSSAGTYTVIITNSLTGCQNTSNLVAVSLNLLPTAYTVTGGGCYCLGDTGVTVGLANSQSGVNYQLQLNGSDTVSQVAGTGEALSFGNQTGAGTYTVIAINDTTSCSVNMTSSVNVIINPLPNVYNITGGGSFCSGDTGVAVGLANSQSGVNYQLQINGSDTGLPVAGTGFALSFSNQTGAGTYTVVATNDTTSCVNNMTDSVTVTVNALPTAYNVTGGGLSVQAEQVLLSDWLILSQELITSYRLMVLIQGHQLQVQALL